MPKCEFANNWFVVAILVACVLVTGQVSAADVHAILELASKTYATFDSVKYRADYRCRVVGQPSKSVTRIRLHRHFDLLDIKSLSFHDEKDETSVRFNRTTFGRRFGVSYQTSGHLNEVEGLVPKTGFVSENDRELKRLSLVSFMVQYGGWLDGYLGTSQHRLSEIVAKSNPRIVKEEVVDGLRLIEVEATTRYGRISIWVSPDEGCLIRRGIVRKSGNDTMLLNIRFDSPENPMSPLENPLTSWVGEFSVDSVSERDGGWIADSGTATISQVHADGEKFARACKVVRKEVNVKPEFAEYLFESDLPAGTLVVFTDQLNSEVTYTWDGIQPILSIPVQP
ncbi:hypothetical protein [Roseimaritima ulvae]|uniref:Uncharacterized protein n=1 Tax=Roseimaritima ulvae TaxID=980254 RepID=A0A5B9QVR6_9BACT|nr:hypothetical protein [Roseimaritima ulvae]QEG41465.1 hypothetical protein UC8_34870 [Roseimaritima ulvae]